METKKGYFNFDFNFFSELEEETNRKLNLTERCIIAYIKGWERGYYGSQNTLAKRLGISERTANRTISTLLKDGFLFKEGKFLYYNKPICIFAYFHVLIKMQISKFIFMFYEI